VCGCVGVWVCTTRGLLRRRSVARTDLAAATRRNRGDGLQPAERGISRKPGGGGVPLAAEPEPHVVKGRRPAGAAAGQTRPRLLSGGLLLGGRGALGAASLLLHARLALAASPPPHLCGAGRRARLR